MLTNTNGSRIEAGIHQFEIVTAPKEVSAGGFQKMEFEFKVVGTDDKPIKMSFFDNQMGDLLRACGCAEPEPGVFDWEVMDVFGKQFSAELFYEEDKKGKINDKTGKIQTYRKLRNFKAVENPTPPFQAKNPGGVQTPEEVWNE